MVLVKCQDFSAGYENKIVLKNISFQIAEGDYLCVIGENGVGKTTLIESILGLQKNTSGILEKNFKLNELGYISQQTNIQKDFPATVEEIVLSGLQGRMLFPFYRKKDKNIALEMMEKFGIKSFSKKSFRELSGGQQQRVLLSRAMCAAKKILILDEPVTGLDTKVTEELYNFIRLINKEGMTIIMITHDSEVIKDASHVLSMGSEGSVGSEYFFGTKDSFLQFNQPSSNQLNQEKKQEQKQE